MMRFFANLPACTVVMEACAGAHFLRKNALRGGVLRLKRLPQPAPKELPAKVHRDGQGKPLLHEFKPTALADLLDHTLGQCGYQTSLSDNLDQFLLDTKG